MSTLLSVANSKTSPFPGPVPFDRARAEFFKGREREVSDIFNLVLSYQVVIIYSQSGAGKTSLVQAGLMPLLGEAAIPYFQTRVGGDVPPGVNAGAIKNIFTYTALSRVAGSNCDLTGIVSYSLLMGLQSFLPDGTNIRYRLEGLRHQQALEAIVEPAKAVGVNFERGASESFVANLRTVKVHTRSGLKTIEGQFIEPVHLQVVCLNLWNSLAGEINGGTLLRPTWKDEWPPVLWKSWSDSTLSERNQGPARPGTNSPMIVSLNRCGCRTATGISECKSASNSAIALAVCLTLLAAVLWREEKVRAVHDKLKDGLAAYQAGKAAVLSSDWAAAAQYYSRAQGLFREIRDTNRQAEAELEAGRAALHQQNLGQALLNFLQASAHFKQAGSMEDAQIADAYVSTIQILQGATPQVAFTSLDPMTVLKSADDAIGAIQHDGEPYRSLARARLDFLKGLRIRNAAKSAELKDYLCLHNTKVIAESVEQAREKEGLAKWLGNYPFAEIGDLDKSSRLKPIIVGSYLTCDEAKQVAQNLTEFTSRPNLDDGSCPVCEGLPRYRLASSRPRNHLRRRSPEKTDSDANAEQNRQLQLGRLAARRRDSSNRKPSASACWPCWRCSLRLVALLLAGIGLYGVLDYSVFRRRREIGIRMAIGAQAGDIARRVTAEVFSMVLAGALAGLALGMISARYIETLLYQVKSTDLGVLALPSLTVLTAALLAALPVVIHAVRIDPVAMLRSE